MTRAKLDITRDLCPMTFVKTKLELEELAPGDLLEVTLREGEPLLNVARSVEEDGHAVLEKTRVADGIWMLLIHRNR
ncbi:sulfurtransferase TusA family protein [bacterium]|nr:sulfurtransferase TusA family protein [bacterium]